MSIFRGVLISVLIGLLGAACGRIDKMAEPLARPPILAYEPVQPNLRREATAAEMAAEEYEFERQERLSDDAQISSQEPTGSLPGRNPKLATRTPLPEPEPRAPAIAQDEPAPHNEQNPSGWSRRAHRIDPVVIAQSATPREPRRGSHKETPMETVKRSPHPTRIPALPPVALMEPAPVSPPTPAPLRIETSQPEAAPPAVVPTVPQLPPDQTLAGSPEMTFPLAPATRTPPPRANPNPCPPADRDGTVRCPILAGWVVGTAAQTPFGDPGGHRTVVLLLAILVAAGAFDLLRRVLR
jgi:hypothetical protein